MTIVATAGHVDHGKSSLVARLTGIDPDRWPEEKARGLTIDLGFATMLIDRREIAFVDLPGHTRFLRNMLAGIGGAQACLFVVAATEGWKEQSEEHLRIIEALGITQLVVALTKVDLVDSERAEQTKAAVMARLAASSVIDPKIVLVSPVTGEGIEELSAALFAMIGDCPTLPDRGRPRLWIDRSFIIGGAGTVVTGSLADGAFRVGHEVRLVPSGAVGKIRGLENHGITARMAVPGERTAVNLTGLSAHTIERGMALVRPNQWFETEVFDADLQVAAGLDHDVGAKGAYVIHVGTGDWAISMRLIGSASIEPGGTGLIRVRLPQRLALIPGDRFVVRESGRREVIGGGRVLDIDPVLPTKKARPNLDPMRIVAERGWVTPDALQLLTGHRMDANVPPWVVDPRTLSITIDELGRRISSAGDTGLDVAVLDEHDRGLLTANLVPDVVVEFGAARRSSAPDPLEGHPWVQALKDSPFAPPPPMDIDPQQLRLMQRRGIVVTLDGVYFHSSSIAMAEDVVTQLLLTHPEGVTVAQVRDALGSTRKHVLPLLNRLDARGITKRLGDLRVPGQATSA